MTSHRDLLRFFEFVRRSGDHLFANRLAQILDRELRALPRGPGTAAPPHPATRVLVSLVDQLRLGAA